MFLSARDPTSPNLSLYKPAYTFIGIAEVLPLLCADKHFSMLGKTDVW
jgi:hypothetical protein